MDHGPGRIIRCGVRPGGITDGQYQKSWMAACPNIQGTSRRCALLAAIRFGRPWLPESGRRRGKFSNHSAMDQQGPRGQALPVIQEVQHIHACRDMGNGQDGRGAADAFPEHRLAGYVEARDHPPGQGWGQFQDEVVTGGVVEEEERDVASISETHIYTGNAMLTAIQNGISPSHLRIKQIYQIIMQSAWRH
jgi:hypothetical protein